MARAKHQGQIPSSEWPVTTYQCTYPQRMAMEAVPHHIHTALIGGNRCLGGETLVQMADGSEKPIRDVQRGDLVDTPVGPREVEATVKKGPDPMVRVTLSDGRSFRATPDHRVLDVDGEWLQSSRLQPGCVLSPPGSSSAPSPSTRDEGDSRSTKIAQGSTTGCFAYRHRGDEPPLRVPGSDRGAVPSRAGVRAHARSGELSGDRSGHAGDSLPTPGHSHPCQPSVRRSNSGAPAQVAVLDVEWGSREWRTVSRLFVPRSQAVQHTIHACGVHPQPTSEFGRWATHELSAPWVVSVEDTLSDYHYDLTIPGPESFVAEGVTHHNTGKTELLFWLFIKAALGAFSCKACGSSSEPSCQSCHGRSWAPEPSNFAIVSLSRDQGRGALQDKINQFALSLPYPQVLASKTTREGLTNPLIFANGSTISIRTIGQHWQAMQGAEYTGVGFDEQPDLDIWKEMQFRMRPGIQTRFIYAMTPTEGIDWFYRDMIEPNRSDVAVIYASIWENGLPPCKKCKKTRKQWEDVLRSENFALARRGLPECKAFCPRCRTYGVEPRMTPKQIAHFENTVEGDEQMMRLYGHFATIGKEKVFSHEEQMLLKQHTLTAHNEYEGRFVFEEPKPQHNYTIGCDTSEGIGKDESVITVMNGKTGNVACVWGDNEAPPAAITAEIHDVQDVYNSALTCVEWASTGMGVIQDLIRLRVPLYQHRSPRARRNNPTHKQYGYIGGPTGQEFIKRQLIKAIQKTFKRLPGGQLVIDPDREAAVYCADKETVSQLCMLGFDLNDKNKLRVPKGYKDDRIMALALAHEARQTRHCWGKEDTPEDFDVMREYEKQVLRNLGKKHIGTVYG